MYALQSLISPDQAAQILGISPGTLQVWRSTGRYNLRFTKVGGRVMYRPEDLQAFIERRTMDHTE
ncbi:MAG: helix-turn-helix domain-containing protein [Candidatus Thiodiazotropha taylori]|nr:helix-turn-helix domain-containing protein [Candidatus Thiodiazotropha taylori]